MPFPDVPRVIYGKNPLQQVICQIQFPPILKIDVDIPAEFQERVRANFPDFTEIAEMRLDASQAIGRLSSDSGPQFFQSSNSKNYEFSLSEGEDELWRINLTRTFIALSTTKYERWEFFKAKLEDPLNALVEIYKPTHFSRVGLRYINVLKRSKLGLEKTDWKELLQPHLLGAFGSEGVGNNVQGFESGYQILLEDNKSQVRLLARIFLDSDNETCFIIDSDFFRIGNIELDDTLGLLDYLNKRSSRLIRWCITPKLHDAMEPHTI